MLDFVGSLDALGPQREPTTWVAFESSTPTVVKPRRRKGSRGRLSAAEMAALVAGGGGGSKKFPGNLRPEQIEALRLKREPKDHSVTSLEQEDGEGNVEYKLRIRDPHPLRLQQLITQMKFRLSEGNGECFYYIGVEDNGYPKGLEPADLEGSIGTLQHMASSLGAAASLVHYLPGAWGRRAALLRVATATSEEACHTDLRVAVAGAVDAGKSTLVAVLTHGSGGRPLLDNGRGLARMNVFRHKHEMQSGRTSSICHQLLGYDKAGRVVNYTTPAAAALTPAEVTSSSAQVLTFLDLAGHEKYLKTALYGLTALLPHYGLLAVCGAAGLGRVGVEHLAVALALEVPVAVVITKVELVRPERFAALVAEVRQLLGLALGAQRGRGEEAAAADSEEERRLIEAASPLVTTEAEAQAAAAALGAQRAASLSSPTARGPLALHMPIFAVSAVTGAGLPVLHAFLAALQPTGPTAPPAAAVPATGAVVAEDAGAGTGAVGGEVAGDSSGACAESSGGGGGGYASSSGTGPSPGGSPRAASAAAVAAAAAAAANSPGHQVLCSLQLAPDSAPSPAAAAPPFVAAATPMAPAAAADQAVHFQVDGTFEVEGVGSVLSGTVLSGTVTLGQELVLGPNPAGGFTRVVVRQLQRSHVAVQKVRAGQTATIAISPAEATSVPGQGRAPKVPGAVAPAAAPLPRAGPLPAAAAAAGSVAAAAAATSSAGGGDFGDALAAAQAALDLCLGGSDEDLLGGGDGGGAGGGGDDDLFGFDVSDGPASPPPGAGACGTATPPSPSLSPCSSFYTSSPGGMAGSMIPISMSVTQLHSTVSFCVTGGDGDASDACRGGGKRGGGGGGPGVLSTSAPAPRMMSLSAVVASMGPEAGVGGRGRGKGRVLLEPALQPRTSWAFEAVLILLGGHWPPRGLLSGRWPPAGEDDIDPSALAGLALGPSGAQEAGPNGAPASEGSGSMTPAAGAEGPGLNGAGGNGAAPEGGSDTGEGGVPVPGAGVAVGGGRQASVGGRSGGRRRRQRSAGGGSYVTVVHCGSIRQPAQVVMMQELNEAGDDPDLEPGALGGQLRISASTRAAAALLHSARAQPGSPSAGGGANAGAGGAPAADGDLGCLVRVVLRWQHRPEWLLEGSKLLVRDRSGGRVAGAGFVRRVLDC
ncbi:hypothetical protein HYH03_000552 [Edaphochlamys debaryana]|uniref:Tr-type G domain-containing protein n=1 Tax=Edaphochlamys debaryana TaxID=47281 RepID=A0A835YIX0_9CHLO|nr:hypothetical protein HYH03_000552 [Edaphochlamys debaryana]|eukprot:KAG2502058.1 hypothetical protein HYH03_000552 [Edaphochlamys debaryana]